MRVACVIVLLSISLAGTRGLRDVTVQVPPTASRGATVTLRCLYDLEGDSLYMLKWYMGKEEFYRFVPKELPPTRVFPLPGFDVDVGSSDAHQVVLRSVTLKMSGRYRCEVSADATFHTAMVARWMHVVELPEGKPEISSEKRRYAVGDTLRTNCTTAKSTPPANVTWWINGIRVNETWSRLVTETEMRSSGTSAPGEEVEEVPAAEAPVAPAHEMTESIRGAVRSGLESELGAASFRDGKVHVRCEASLFGMAREAAELLLEEEKPRLASVLGTRESHPSPPAVAAAASAARGTLVRGSSASLALAVTAATLMLSRRS